MPWVVDWTEMKTVALNVCRIRLVLKMLKCGLYRASGIEIETSPASSDPIKRPAKLCKGADAYSRN